LRADIVIIGGGSTGASIAHSLAKNNAGRIVLLEKSRIASGMTALSGAIVRLHYSVPTLVSLALTSWKILKDMEVNVGGPSGFKGCGVITAVGERDLQKLESNVSIQRQVGVNTGIVTPEELKDLQPGVDVEGISAAAFEPDSGYADPQLTTQSFAKKAVELGCEIRENTEIVGFELRDGSISKIKTNTEPIEASKIVNASGIWSNQIFGKIGAALPIMLSKMDVAYIKRTPQANAEHVFMDLQYGFVTKPESATRIQFGSLSPKAMSKSVPAPEMLLGDMDEISPIAENIIRRFPALAHEELFSNYAGLYDVTPDWNPIIGCSAKIKNLYHAVGMSGHGFKLSPSIGMIMSEILLKGKCSFIPDDFFAEGRFESGNESKPTYGFGVLS